MINQLNRVLSELLRESGAQAAVIWSLHDHPSEGIVLTSCPRELLLTGVPWPVPDTHSDALVRDPAELAMLVPTTLRIGMPDIVTAARSIKLGDSNLYLLMVWCGTVARDDLGEAVDHLISEQITYLAPILDDSRFNRGEVERLRAMVDDLDVGLVSLDPGLGRASLNNAAAKLLNLPQGFNESSAFAAAMTALSDRAINRKDLGGVERSINGDPRVEIDGVWRFPTQPTDVRVMSHPTHHGGFDGRVWAFYDESQLSRALGDSETARSLLRANADALLDPQVLLESRRDSGGTIIDFIYRDVNEATCHYLGLTREDLIGHGVVETMPNIETSGLLADYTRCLLTGEPVVHDDFSYDNEILLDTRRYDIRATRAGPNAITLTWRDVTERFQSAQRISESEERFRLLTENVGDVVCRVSGDGTFQWVSSAITQALGGPPESYIGRPVREIVPPEDQANHIARLQMIARGEPYIGRAKLIGSDGTPHSIHLFIKPYYGPDGQPDGMVSTFRVIDREVAAEAVVEEANRLQLEADARFRRLMDNAAVSMCVTEPDGRFATVNDAMCAFFGYDAEMLTQLTWQQITAPEYLQADLLNVEQMMTGQIDSYRLTKQFIHADGHRLWGDLSVSCMRDEQGLVESFIGQIVDITSEVEAQQAVAQYKQVVEQSNIGINVVRADGPVLWINQAMCDMFGLDAATAMQMTWQEITPEENLEANLRIVEDLIAGRAELVRGTQHYVHADGHKVWVDVSVSCLHDSHGAPEYICTQMLDVTAQVEARQQLLGSEEKNRALAKHLQSEINGAARYLQSVLPSDLNGPVAVSTRYLPSQTLGGDCFDYHWIDDDHLIVYLLDVSGHGVESALIAVSVHNMLRSTSLSTKSMLEPDQVLTSLNNQFAMDQHDFNYFTIFYGVYQASTRTLRYANGGHPPALLLTGGQLTELPSQSPPIGMLDDIAFTTTTVPIPPESQLLLYSDGAYEISLEDGTQWSQADFAQECKRLAGPPELQLDTLIDTLRHRSASHTFEDDACLVRLTFD